MNIVIISGRSGGKPELQQTNSGTQVARLSIATSERRKVGDNWEEKTSWHNVTLFGKTAENASKAIDKGDSITVQGKLSYRTVEKDGKKQHFTDIIADSVEWSKKAQGGTREAETEIPF